MKLSNKEKGQGAKEKGNLKEIKIERSSSVLNKIGKIILVGLFLIACYLLFKKYSLNEIRTLIQSYGSLSPIIYIVLFTILPAFLFPVPVLVLASGLVFGLKMGVIYTLVGALFNSILMFFVGRKIGKERFESFIEKKLSLELRSKLLSEDQKSLFVVFFMLRLVPLVSYNLINYISGLTRIRLIPYLISTVIGILPGTIVFINTGDKSTDVKSRGFIISIILLVGLILFSVIALKIYLKKNSKKDEKGD